MSRHTIVRVLAGQRVAYGFDAFCGYFLQVEDVDTGEVLLDADGRTHSRNQIIDLMVEHSVPQEHLRYVMLDLPMPQVDVATLAGLVGPLDDEWEDEED